MYCLSFFIFQTFHIFFCIFHKTHCNHHDYRTNRECRNNTHWLKIVHGTFSKQQSNRKQNKQNTPHQLNSISHLFIARQQACIQIAAAIYTQARLRTSLFCFLLYQLSLWWVKYRAQPEAISTWNHAGRNAPWQAETVWGEKVKPRKPAWNQDFFWLSICGCQVRNKNFTKK